jgi:hypothetical protein
MTEGEALAIRFNARTRKVTPAAAAVSAGGAEWKP